MKSISIGKYRGLQQCATPRGGISVLALDHRNNLRQSLNPGDPNLVKDSELTDFKIQVVNALAPSATAVLLDPQFGAAQCIAARALPGQVGLLTSVEESGYSGDATSRSSGFLPGWSVAKSRRMGATAIKLLVYYHPQAPTASAIVDLVKQVVQDCRENDIPLFLETLSYSLDPMNKKLSPDERRKVVIETAARLTPLGADILKAEFPVDIQAVTDDRQWAAACADLSSASVIPWVLLSASVGYDTFLRQVTVACQEGASGVAVGRAVWKEATGLNDTDRINFLEKTASSRMARVTALCDALARPWTDFYSPPSINSTWYPTY
jgi:tagatose 1,6-diphosphate aldolase